jgi:4-amino-4-deoxy-L-arabinose transferase-like glycosyltransferase
MQRVIAILFGALLCGGTALAIGTILFWKLRVQTGRGERFALAFVVGSVCFSQVVFILCCIGLARTEVFLAIGLLSAIGAIKVYPKIGTRPPSTAMPGVWKWTLAVRGRSGPVSKSQAKPPAPPTWINSLRSRVGQAFSLPDFCHGLLGLAFAVFGVVYLVNALAPEASPDGSAYHLPLVAQYLDAHGFRAMPENFYASLPQGIELLFLPAFAIGGSSAAAMVHLLFLIDLAVLIICYGRRSGFAVPASIAAFLVFASPVVGWDGTSAYNDVAAAAILFGLFYLLQVWDRERVPRILIPIGILAGGSYAVKYTAAIAIPYAAGFLAWKLWRGRKPLLRPLVTVSALAALFVLPWMIKNAVFVGNPVAPFANALFPNPNVHVSFEKQYVSSLRHYQLTSALQAPWEVTVKGEKLQGYFGPVFLLIPLALLSLGRREGRRLLLAGAVFAIPWFFNVGTRFLIPALPPLTVALALVLSRPTALLPAVAMVHAFLSWYATPVRYFDTYAPRIASLPLRAAFGIEPEESYLARVNPGYRVARLVERAVPAGEKVFSFEQIAAAWTTREVLVGYYSAENEALGDILTSTMAQGLCPERALDLHFAPRQIRGLRAIQRGPADKRMWQVSEFEMFSDRVPLPPEPSWRFHANPNSWDARLAFDQSVVTRWQSWQATMPGMFLEVDFPTPMQIDRVRLLTPTDALQAPIELQGMDANGGWYTIPTRPSTTTVDVHENLRTAAIGALLDRGIRYLLVSPGAFGANEFHENANEWGIREVGEAGGTRLYRVKDIRSEPPPAIVPVSDSALETPPGTYDDTDPRITLRGPWMRDAQFLEPYHHTLTYTNIPGASISLAFTGSSITYVYTRGHNRGIAEVWIDDRLRERLDLYSSDTEWESRTTYDSLGPGPHVIRIRVTGQRQHDASDCFVDLDALIVGNRLPS